MLDTEQDVTPSREMSSSQASVSVIITCFNQACFLGEAIESVLRQTYPPAEVIVVDDGSKDDPSEVTARYECVRLINQTNQGVAVARNRGLRESRGQYVIFLDADDRLLPTALEVGVGYFQSQPQFAFVVGHHRLIDAEGYALPTRKPDRIGGNYYAELMRSNFILMPATVIFKREVLDSVGGFNTAMDHGCDFDLYLRIARNFPIYWHEHSVAEWRQHGTNTSRKSSLMLKCSLAVLRSQRDYIKANEYYEEAYQTGKRNFQHLYGEQLAHDVRMNIRARKNWDQVASGIILLLRYYPQGLINHAKRKLSRLFSHSTERDEML